VPNTIVPSGKQWPSLVKAVSERFRRGDHQQTIIQSLTQKWSEDYVRAAVNLVVLQGKDLGKDFINLRERDTFKRLRTSHGWTLKKAKLVMKAAAMFPGATASEADIDLLRKAAELSRASTIPELTTQWRTDRGFAAQDRSTETTLDVLKGRKLWLQEQLVIVEEEIRDEEELLE